MRWNESEKVEDDTSKPKERETPLSKPGKVDAEQLQAAKNRPFLGGNYNA